MNKEINIAIIGLGYVGLPLAIAFAKKYNVVGFDTDNNRVGQLKNGIDYTHEANIEELKKVIVGGLTFSSEISSIAHCNIYIVTVPTPINKLNQPDLSFLLEASFAIGGVLKKEDVVIYESTVYPGCTEEECVPLLEQVANLRYNIDFFCGYSPERISPGDKIHTLTTVKKVTSGSTPEIASFVDKLYSSIINAGTHLAPSIKVAEASKAIENAQRDINISFINEMALIFDRMGIDTTDVLNAAATKWNFLNFKPGLVGGHCISVDPYYLAYKAEQLGYKPEVLLSGRKVNNNMASFVANKVIRMMKAKAVDIKSANVLLLGLTFKENCPDIRNTRVIDIFTELSASVAKVDVYDPWADQLKVEAEFGIELIDEIHTKKYNAIVLAVAHHQFLHIDFSHFRKNGAVIFDIKSFLSTDVIDGRL